MIEAGMRRFAQGRYGFDRLNGALLLAGLALLLPAALVSPWLLLVPALPLGWMLYRALSRDYDARRAENGRFRRLADPARRLRCAARRDRRYRYFKCGACGRALRAPRETDSVTCCACGARQQKTS